MKNPLSTSSAKFPSAGPISLRRIFDRTAISGTVLALALLAWSPSAEAGEHCCDAAAKAAVETTLTTAGETPNVPVPPSSRPSASSTGERDAQNAADQGEERRAGDSRRGRAEPPEDMVVLDRLLAMPPEQLTRIRRAVEHIEKLSPDEREALRERLHHFREISPEDRRRMREHWRDLSPSERREFIQEMHERRWQQVFEAPTNPSDKESDK